MEPLCDFCGRAWPVVYCKPDMAKLCLNCDECVHSANSLSRKHPRSILCEKCFSQPAIVQCIDDKFSFCHNCHLNGSGCSNGAHTWQKLNCYTGCLSPGDYARILSLVLDTSSFAGSDSTKPMIAFPVGETSVPNSSIQGVDGRSIGWPSSKLSELDPWTTASPPSLGSSPPVYMPPYCRDQVQMPKEDINLDKVGGLR